MQILHITPHLGGGVGAVLHNYFSKVSKSDDTFKLACLDKISDVQEQAFSVFVDKVYFNLGYDINELVGLIKQADIVVLHWWNHPLLFNFIVREKLPACRLAIWSHVSGLGGTSILTEKITSYPDKFILTTPISKTALSENQLRNFQDEASTIWSTASMPSQQVVKKSEQNQTIKLLYVGTLDDAKLSKYFLYLFSQVVEEDVELTVMGGEPERLKEEAKLLGIDSSVKFLGMVSNARNLMKDYDIFFYPLNPKHYGTCDQVLGEAMSSGLPVLAFANLMEQSIITDGVNGYLAKNNNEFITNAKKLITEHELRIGFGRAAMSAAKKMYSTKKMIEKWQLVYRSLIKLNKTEKAWNVSGRNNDDLTGLDIFIESVGGEQYKPLKDLNSEHNVWTFIRQQYGWMSKTKGSIFHYADFFYDDYNLIQACNILKIK